MGFSSLLLLCICAIAIVAADEVLPRIPSFKTEDIYVSSTCDAIAEAGDHLLLEYTAIYANGTVAEELKEPEQLFHVYLEFSDALQVNMALKGMCKNSTRRMTWGDAASMNSAPLLINIPGLSTLNEELSLIVRLVHITKPQDYQIFSSFAKRNISHVLDLIDEHLGVNAVDEWGQTALMIAVSTNQIDVVASLLNTRRPLVEINMAKSVWQICVPKYLCLSACSEFYS
jgi:hypothetical protein